MESCRYDHTHNRHFTDIGYHYYIERDGSVHHGRPIWRVGAHCKNHNAHSIGICYEGGLDEAGRPCDTRTREQRASMHALVRNLLKRYPRALVLGHHNLNPLKACPCFNVVKEFPPQ